jgi:hypothetical protein
MNIIPYLVLLLGAVVLTVFLMDRGRKGGVKALLLKNHLQLFIHSLGYGFFQGVSTLSAKDQSVIYI